MASNRDVGHFQAPPKSWIFRNEWFIWDDLWLMHHPSNSRQLEYSRITWWPHHGSYAGRFRPYLDGPMAATLTDAAGCICFLSWRRCPWHRRLRPRRETSSLISQLVRIPYRIDSLRQIRPCPGLYFAPGGHRRKVIVFIHSWKSRIEVDAKPSSATTGAFIVQRVMMLQVTTGFRLPCRSVVSYQGHCVHPASSWHDVMRIPVRKR